MHTIYKSDPKLKQIDASFVIGITQPIPKTQLRTVIYFLSYKHCRQINLPFRLEARITFV